MWVGRYIYKNKHVNNMLRDAGIIRFLFTVVSWLSVPLVYQVTGPRATTVNMIRTINQNAALAVHIFTQKKHPVDPRRAT